MNDPRRISLHSGGYWLAWPLNLCTSANAICRVGPFASFEEAERFGKDVINGSHRESMNYDNEPLRIYTEAWDWTPEEFLREADAAALPTQWGEEC